MSDASLVKRRRGGRGKSQAQRERERQHRFSINGHFYNYKAGPRLRPRPLPLSAPPSSHLSAPSLPPADVHLHAVLRRLHQGSHLQPDDDGPGDRAAAQQVQGEPLPANQNGRSTPGRVPPPPPTQKKGGVTCDCVFGQQGRGMVWEAAELVAKMLKLTFSSISGRSQNFRRWANFSTDWGPCPSPCPRWLRPPSRAASGRLNLLTAAANPADSKSRCK